MAEEMIPIVVCSAFFWCIAYITRVISDNRIKRELIKMKADSQTIDYLMLRSPAEGHEGSLKWGMVIVALGIAFAVIELVGLDGDDPFTWGVLFIFGGGALLSHYALKSRMLSSAD